MYAVTYLVYIVFWESLIFGGCFYATVIKDYSPWLWLLAVLASGASYSPERWKKLF